MKKFGAYLFTLFGFEVRLDGSWLLLGALVAWTLAKSYFPSYFPGFINETYWAMGIAGAIGLFFSIVLHELCHSLMGRAYGIRFLGITLFIFGGVAQMDEAPPSPKAEFMMAMVGPLFSLLLSLVCYLIFLAGFYLRWPMPVNGIFYYLAVINFMLGIFNLLPGYPLDGGRVLRAILWWWKKDLLWATRIAASCGAWLGILLIAYGIYQFIAGATIAGIWSVLLGLFLQRIAKVS